MAVRVERDGAVYTVVLDRPQVRNAVDREHAEALADAFRAFEKSDAAVAVLFGPGHVLRRSRPEGVLEPGRAGR